MRHRQAIVYLPDFGSGSLDETIEVAVGSHVEGCRACRDWLATRDWLEEQLSLDPAGGGTAGEQHPSSDLLALCVVRPQEVLEPGRQELGAHLASCTLCRHEVTVMRDAIREARPGRGPRSRRVSGEVSSKRPLRRGISGHRWLAAALIILVVGCATLLVGLAFDDRNGWSGVNRLWTEEHFGERAQVAAAIERDELSGLELEGTHVIGRDRRLVVSEVTVQSGADVTFRSAKSVAFGDGFRVAQGARIRVGSRTTESSYKRQIDQPKPSSILEP